MAHSAGTVAGGRTGWPVSRCLDSQATELDRLLDKHSVGGNHAGFIARKFHTQLRQVAIFGRRRAAEQSDEVAGV